MLLLFSTGKQEGRFTPSGGAVGGGRANRGYFQHDTIIASGGAVVGGHSISRRFLLLKFTVSGGGVGGGHSDQRARRSFLPAGGAVGGGKQKAARRHLMFAHGGAVGGGHVLLEFISASKSMREVMLEGNAPAMVELAGTLTKEGFDVIVSNDGLSFWLVLNAIGIIVYFDLVNRGLMRARQAINSGTEVAPVWSYGTPVYLFLRYLYDCPGWLFFSETYVYLVARHDRYNQAAYDCIFAGAANAAGGRLDGCLALIGGSTTGAINMLPLTTSTIAAAGIAMNRETLTGQSVLHLKSLASYFGAGKNGSSGGQGVTGTEIIICDSTGQVKGSLPVCRSTQGADLQPEQRLKTPSNSWITFQNNGSSVILQR